jgi:hypothetical protein
VVDLAADMAGSGQFSFSERRFPVRVRQPFLVPWLVALAIFLLAAMPLGGESRAAPGDQCVACHTDAAKLKALAQEPSISAEEGEG